MIVEFNDVNETVIDLGICKFVSYRVQTRDSVSFILHLSLLVNDDHYCKYFLKYTKEEDIDHDADRILGFYKNKEKTNKLRKSTISIDKVEDLINGAR